MASALLADDRPSAMIDQEDDSNESNNQDNSKNNDESAPSLGAIFQTAYTSSLPAGSSSSSRNPTTSSAAASSATASGPRISNTSDLFAPELDTIYEDPSSQLFADDSDHDDQHVLDHGRNLQALFVDTSSPRRSPMPGSSSSGALAGYPGLRGAASGLHQDPFAGAVFFPSPLMTSTAPL